MIRLLIFDVDGTLAESFRLRLMPGVKEFFRLLADGNCPNIPQLAIATNQGGVGMRYWMEQGTFGRPGKYPDEAEVAERLKKIIQSMGAAPDLPVYVAYRYLDRKGKWSPVPPERAEDPRWQETWRKPGPGMLLQAMLDADAAPEETLFVGDSPDDQNAARAAGCHFRWANDFFSREWHGCGALAAALEEPANQKSEER